MNPCDFLSLAVEGMQGLKPYQPGKPIEQLQRELGLSDIIKLASNENPLGFGEQAEQAMQDVIKQAHRYPDGAGYSLKQALSAKLDLDPMQITLGNGSNDVLELIARVFVQPCHEVIFSQHAFAVYPIVTQALNAKAVVIPAKNFAANLQVMAQAITSDTRLIFIANPNNPTGTYATPAEIKHFLSLIPPYVLLVLDEAYYDYIAPENRVDSLAWVTLHPNLIVVRTFSKAHGLAGLRIGYAVSHPDIADLLNRLRQPFNANIVALAAAEAALDDEVHLAKTVLCNEAGKAQLQSGFEQLGLAYIPTEGNFITVDTGRPAGPVYQAMLEQGVIVRPIANYGLDQHLRVSIGHEHENKRCLHALGLALSQ